MTIKLDELLRNANEIMADNTLSDYQKSVALAAMMTDMERKFQIPLLNDPEWNAAHPEIVRAYRQISNMRPFD